MVIIMDMAMGRHIEDEFGAFEEEVLNAQWLPQPVQAQLDMRKTVPSTASRTLTCLDADAFLRNVYLSQE